MPSDLASIQIDSQLVSPVAMQTPRKHRVSFSRTLWWLGPGFRGTNAKAMAVRARGIYRWIGHKLSAVHTRKETRHRAIDRRVRRHSLQVHPANLARGDRLHDRLKDRPPTWGDEVAATSESPPSAFGIAGFAIAKNGGMVRCSRGRAVLR
jgi:hypothetical protein